MVYEVTSMNFMRLDNCLLDEQEREKFFCRKSILLGVMEIEAPVKILDATIRTRIGNKTTIGAFTTINGGGKLNDVRTIGRMCQIAEGCFLWNANHPTSTLSTNSLFYGADAEFFGGGRKVFQKL